MLRRCIQRASSLQLSSRTRRALPAAGQTHDLAVGRGGQRRSYGLSRHPDPLAPRVDLNTLEDEDIDGKCVFWSERLMESYLLSAGSPHQDVDHALI